MQNAPRATGRVRLVLELESSRDPRPTWWRVSLSIPGREGTMTRTWAAEGGILEQGQVDDLHTWILEALSGGLSAAVGIQQVLPAG